MPRPLAETAALSPERVAVYSLLPDGRRRPEPLAWHTGPGAEAAAARQVEAINRLAARGGR